MAKSCLSTGFSPLELRMEKNLFSLAAFFSGSVTGGDIFTIMGLAESNTIASSLLQGLYLYSGECFSKKLAKIKYI